MEILLCIGAILLLLIGIAAVFLPVLPTPFLSWCAFLLCFIFWKDSPISGIWFAIASALTLFTHGFEIVGSYFGAKWFGATWRGGVGALIGGIFGTILFLFLPVPGGVIIGAMFGPIVGAFCGELIADRTKNEASKAAIGTLVGNLAAMLLKLFTAIFLFALFSSLVAVHVGAPWTKKIFNDTAETESIENTPPQEIFTSDILR